VYVARPPLCVFPFLFPRLRAPPTLPLFPYTTLFRSPADESGSLPSPIRPATPRRGRKNPILESASRRRSTTAVYIAQVVGRSRRARCETRKLAGQRSLSISRGTWHATGRIYPKRGCPQPIRSGRASRDLRSLPGGCHAVTSQALLG